MMTVGYICSVVHIQLTALWFLKLFQSKVLPRVTQRLYSKLSQRQIPCLSFSLPYLLSLSQFPLVKHFRH